jgi:prephenate dehydrogenase
MPKIGTGEAGGSWGLISNLIAEELSAKGVAVTVYETTGKRPSRNKQTGLFDEITHQK